LKPCIKRASNLKTLSGRQLKRHVLALLQQNDLTKCESELCRLPARQTVNPLFSFLCSVDEIIKWRAVAAMGAVVSNLATTDLESARVIMRRFMWQLNDESGGIGWGCPEAMGETTARSHQLAKEYAGILLSYIRADGNFLEHELLQRGALWGVGRLARARPDFLKGCASLFNPYMQSNDAYLRGLAVWAVEPLLDQGSIPALEALSNDSAELMLFRKGRLAQCTVSQLAREALFAHDQNLNT
jgi:hypothetical protein